LVEEYIISAPNTFLEPTSSPRSSNEFADYALLDRLGRPLAIVEAKKSSRDALSGERQAADYADALRAKHGIDPFVFLANGDEIWFLCHVVHHSSPRQYYHIIVVLDKMSLKFKRHSILFKFNGKPIEYSLGLIVEDERICMSYSQNDSTSAIVSVPMTTVLEKLF
jgi:hypothetical protein